MMDKVPRMDLVSLAGILILFFYTNSLYYSRQEGLNVERNLSVLKDDLGRSEQRTAEQIRQNMSIVQKQLDQILQELRLRK